MMTLRAAYFRIQYDLDSMYEPWETELQMNQQKRIQAKCAELEAIGFEACSKFSLNALNDKAALQHFRHVADPAKIFSIQPEQQSILRKQPALQSLKDYFHGNSSSSGGVLDEWGAGDKPWFFKVLPTFPRSQDRTGGPWLVAQSPAQPFMTKTLWHCWTVCCWKQTPWNGVSANIFWFHEVIPLTHWPEA